MISVIAFSALRAEADPFDTDLDTQIIYGMAQNKLTAETPKKVSAPKVSGLEKLLSGAPMKVGVLLRKFNLRSKFRVVEEPKETGVIEVAHQAAAVPEISKDEDEVEDENEEIKINVYNKKSGDKPADSSSVNLAELNELAATTILPVTAPPKEDSNGLNLKMPEELFDLASVFTKNMSVLGSKNSVEIEPESADADIEALDTNIDLQSGDGDASAEANADEARGDTDAELTNDDDTQNPNRLAERTNITFVRHEKNFKTKNVALQVIDDRSVINEKILYPIVGARVEVIGTGLVKATNSKGIVELSGLPADASFLVSVDDPNGVIRPYIKEIHLGSVARKEIVYLTGVRNKDIFSSYEKIAGTTQDANRASMCAKVKDISGRTVEGVLVTLDTPAVGPVYFNRFGFMDRAVGSTAQDGRFCFFNIEPGPLALNFFAGNDHLATVTTATFSGRHMEEDFIINDQAFVNLHLAASPTAHDQFNSDDPFANKLQAIDYIEVVPLGYGEALNYSAFAQVISDEKLSFQNDQLYVLSQAPEFETTLFQIDKSQSEQNASVLNVFPRGFIEGMFTYAQEIEKQDLEFDPTLGVVIAEHGDFQGQENEMVNIRLLNELGEKANDEYKYGDHPVAKNIFFNLQPGKYTLVVETNQGYLLALKTVVVFSETLSYVTSGTVWQTGQN